VDYNVRIHDVQNRRSIGYVRKMEQKEETMSAFVEFMNYLAILGVGLLIVLAILTVIKDLQKNRKKEIVKEELAIYGMGIIHCSICTNVKSRKRVEELVNSKSPTGIKSHWTISRDKKFATGEPNPCPCNQKPKTHKHYLMEC